MTEWYYASGGQSHGPFPEDELRWMVARSQLAPDALVWSASLGGASEWVSVADTDIARPIVTPVRRRQAPARGKRRAFFCISLACVCAALLAVGGLFALRSAPMGADEFFKLCGEGTAEDIIAALERGTVPDARPESASVGRTSPLVAAVLNDLDINVGGMKNITTPLIAVILNGETDEPGVISAFARSGADMNARDGSSGFTALMYASEAGKREMMKELARSGADVNAADDAGRTALMYAITGNQPGLVSDLIRIGADVNARDNRGRSAFSLSINPNVDSAIAIELIKNGANVNEFISSRDEWRVNDVSILMLAIINKCRPEVISALLDGGADVNAGTTKYGDTALLYAISGKSDPAITISLIERGAELNRKYLVHHGAAFKYTALMWAIIYRSDIEVLRRMIRRGADVNARIGNGPSALDCAIDEQYAEAIALLKQHGAKK